MTSTVEPAYDEGTTEERRKENRQQTQTYGSGQRKEQKTRTPPSRTKGNIMKNNTFNQVINANLASIDPGFGQFALAKASSDLFKKVLNK